MTEISNYNLYTMNLRIFSIDKVDGIIKDLQLMQTYEEVVDFINKNFGYIEKSKLIDYPELKKQVEIKFKDDAVEFFAAKNWKQYFGRGWKKSEI